MVVSTNDLHSDEIFENDGEVFYSKISFRYLYLILGNPELISEKAGNSEILYSSVNTSSVSTLHTDIWKYFKRDFFRTNDDYADRSSTTKERFYFQGGPS